MDPTAAMIAFDEAYETGDRAALAEHAEALADWLAKGGAHPSPASLGWRSNMSKEQLLNFFATCKGIAKWDAGPQPPAKQPASTAISSTKRPQTPGYYLWYILDLSYFSVGAVQVLADPEKHREYLRGLIADGKDTRQFTLYQNDAGEWLTMYHQAIDTRPECDPTGNPYVDGYRPFNLTEFLGPKEK